MGANMINQSINDIKDLPVLLDSSALVSMPWIIYFLFFILKNSPFSSISVIIDDHRAPHGAGVNRS